MLSLSKTKGQRDTEEVGILLTLVEEGLLSGLVEKSELRELLDELYDEPLVGALTPAP